MIRRFCLIIALVPALATWSRAETQRQQEVRTLIQSSIDSLPSGSSHLNQAIWPTGGAVRVPKALADEKGVIDIGDYPLILKSPILFTSESGFAPDTILRGHGKRVLEISTASTDHKFVDLVIIRGLSIQNPSGDGVGFDQTRQGESTNVRLEDLVFNVAGTAMDLVQRDTAFTYFSAIRDVIVAGWGDCVVKATRHRNMEIDRLQFSNNQQKEYGTGARIQLTDCDQVRFDGCHLERDGRLLKTVRTTITMRCPWIEVPFVGSSSLPSCEFINSIVIIDFLTFVRPSAPWIATASEIRINGPLTYQNNGGATATDAATRKLAFKLDSKSKLIADGQIK